MSSYYEVVVRATWEGEKTFEFDTKEKATDFKIAVDRGNLDAVVAAGDIFSTNTTLIDFEAIGSARKVKG